MSFDRKRKIFERHLAEAYQEFDVAYNQLGRTLSEVDKLHLQRQADDIETKIDRLETKLTSLERLHGDKNRQHLDWQSRLPQINFLEAVEIFDHIHNQFGRDGGAAAFFMQNGDAMGGEWCVRRLKNSLETTDLKHYEIEFPVETPLSLILPVLLTRLGQYVGCDPYDEYKDDQHQYMLTVLDRIGKSLQSGSVVLTEIRIWNGIGFHDQFLPQFLRDVWRPFVDALPNIANRHPQVKFIALIIVNSSLPHKSEFPNLYCGKDDFNNQKIVELPLQSWSSEEITDWLLYVGMTAKIHKSTVERMGHNIYTNCNNGLPWRVEKALMENLRRFF